MNKILYFASRLAQVEIQQLTIVNFVPMEIIILLQLEVVLTI
jgi:hypothetical protein